MANKEVTGLMLEMYEMNNGKKDEKTVCPIFFDKDELNLLNPDTLMEVFNRGLRFIANSKK